MVFWALAQRLSLEFDFLGVPLDMTVPPTEDELLAIIARHSVVPFEELKQQPRGCFDHTPQFAAPADPAAAGRFVTMPDDVDRKSVVEGTSVSVRVDRGGRRFLKKKKIQKTIS